MAVAAINTVATWCVVAPWLLTTADIAQSVVRFAVLCADEGRLHLALDPGLDSGIRHAGARLLHVLLRDIARDESGGGTLPAGKVAVSALLAEEDALRRVVVDRQRQTRLAHTDSTRMGRKEEQKEHEEPSTGSGLSPKQMEGLVTCFSIRGGTSLLSMVELPVRRGVRDDDATTSSTSSRSPHMYGAVTFILRDAHGKYAWTGYRQQVGGGYNEGDCKQAEGRETREGGEGGKGREGEKGREGRERREEQIDQKDQKDQEHQVVDPLVVAFDAAMGNSGNGATTVEPEDDALEALLTLQLGYEQQEDQEEQQEYNTEAPTTPTSTMQPCVPLPTTVVSGGYGTKAEDAR